ncbi:MAG: methylaspartate mutase [Alphaproteobacteria bacterium]
MKSPFDLYSHYVTERKEVAPDWAECLSYLKTLDKPSVSQLLEKAEAAGEMLVQPRCGVGDQEAMLNLLQQLEQGAHPDILSLTIDAHTRLLRFEAADKALRDNPKHLNGYPLIAHGWQQGRKLNKAVRAPIEVRHGSPDARLLFGAALASGFSSFEGGGIGYNVPYCKDVPFADSLSYWRDIDQFSGDLADQGIIIDREFFGTLTAVLMPPSISIAIALLEAALAIQSGVQCLSLAYCQTGNFTQDIAALRALRKGIARYLPLHTKAYPVFHQFMGAFPADHIDANALIIYGTITARLGGATKIINKTHQEALGVPSVEANIAGISLTKAATSWIIGLLPLDMNAVEEEQYWIEREVAELIEPILGASDMIKAIVLAFADGRLDVPFSASIHARSDILPVRDTKGAIRFQRSGQLPFSEAVLQRNAQLTNEYKPTWGGELFHKIRSDILFFCRDLSLQQSESGR